MNTGSLWWMSAGDDPSFELTRISLGQPDAPRANEIRDRVTVRRSHLARHAEGYRA